MKLNNNSERKQLLSVYAPRHSQDIEIRDHLLFYKKLKKQKKI